MAPKMISMKHLLALGALAFSLLLAQTAGFALVPGPILLSDEQLEHLHQAGELVIATTRAKAACLSVEASRFCPGTPIAKAEQLLQLLSEPARKRTLLFGEGGQLKGVLALLPAEIKLPPPKLGAAPIALGAEARAFSEIRALLPGLPAQKPFDQAIASGLAAEDLKVWYYAESHLGLVTHASEQGEYVIGAFVAK